MLISHGVKSHSAFRREHTSVFTSYMIAKSLINSETLSWITMQSSRSVCSLSNYHLPDTKVPGSEDYGQSYERMGKYTHKHRRVSPF